MKLGFELTAGSKVGQIRCNRPSFSEFRNTNPNICNWLLTQPAHNRPGLIRVKRGGIMLIKRDNFSGPELMFLSLTAAGVISIIVAGLQVVFRFVG
jgi:hypothetical protein